MTMKIDWLRLLPAYWLQNYRTDWEWDAVLNALLDRHEPAETSGHTANIGGIEVWVSNYPYAYGSPYQLETDVLPSVATRKRLRDAVARANRKLLDDAISAALGSR